MRSHVDFVAAAAHTPVVRGVRDPSGAIAVRMARWQPRDHFRAQHSDANCTGESPDAGRGFGSSDCFPSVILGMRRFGALNAAAALMPVMRGVRYPCRTEVMVMARVQFRNGFCAHHYATYRTRESFYAFSRFGCVSRYYTAVFGMRIKLGLFSAITLKPVICRVEDPYRTIIMEMIRIQNRNDLPAQHPVAYQAGERPDACGGSGGGYRYTTAVLGMVVMIYLVSAIAFMPVPCVV